VADTAFKEGAASRAPRLPWRVVLGYSAGQFGTGLLPLVLITWILYFYSPPDGAGLVLLSPSVLGTIRLIERFGGAFFEPLVGHLTDKTNSRFGRRLPWVVLGTPFLLASFTLIWFPPKTAVTNDPRVIVHCAVALMVFFASYTAVVAPYVAMLPEITPDPNERVRVSVWMSVLDVLSNITGAVGAGAIVGLGAITVAGIAFDNGYQLLGAVMGTLGLISFIPVPAFVREPARTSAHEIPFSLKQAVIESLKNPEFVPYACATGGFRFATTCAIVALPFVATELMRTSEEAAGYLQAAIIVVAMVSFPIVDRLSARYGKARVFRWGGLGYVLVLPLIGTVGLISGLPPLVHGAILFVLSGFSTATLFVLPRALIADVIDIDERRTGYRREGMYNGMAGVVEKCGEALGTGVVSYLFEAFGRSASAPLGLRLVGLAGAIGIGMGLYVFRRYSIVG
jgi:GPH family glycoside/pentoside/hexuronide:cation symporter